MKRFTLVVLLMIFAFLNCPAIFAQESKKNAAVENEQTSVALTVSGNTVRIQNATPGSSLEVYNVLGMKVTSIKIDTADKTFTLNLPKGCYILKIENIARKIAIK